MELNQDDIEHIKSHGLSPEKIQDQIETFKKGIPFVKLVAPATLGNLPAGKAGGIRKLSKQERDFYSLLYEDARLQLVKFVPASGAATRMFKELQSFFSCIENFAPLPCRQAGLRLCEREEVQQKDKETRGKGEKGTRREGNRDFEEQINNPKNPNIREFFEHLPDFAFYGELLALAKKSYPGFDGFSGAEKKYIILKTLLEKYASLPKGLIPFHNYHKETRTAFEEHFVEGEKLATIENPTHLHFTVSEGHVEKFRGAIPSWFRDKDRVGFSYQEKHTDTIAVDMENHPFRDEMGNLIFRPAGHGALLENLNQIDADIVFIKNIDNVSTENNLELIVEYKKALAGVLLEIQAEVFQHLHNLQDSTDLQACLSGRQGFQNLVGLNNRKTEKQKPTRSKKDRAGLARQFLKEKFNIQAENLQQIKSCLNRPIRVCGMVKNTGAPGGGPFWVKDADGNILLQIVETSQIDLSNPEQKEILEKSTYFNPVDLVCGIRDYKGKKFDLTQFSNPEQGFISKKSFQGKELKALELPGLWNGAMAGWNTVFVEVPLETFNPVKTVLDLLKPGHQDVAKG